MVASKKSIDAHKGATTIGRWSTDGSALLTGTVLTCCLKLKLNIL